MEPRADIAVIGLAVMGQNLILNMNDHGFTVVAYNRTVSKVDDFLANEAKGTNVLGAHSLQEMASLLKKPRRVMLMVKAGQAVDDFIEQLLGVLEPGDIIIDGGNSNFEDTIRRTKYVESKGLLYIGTGVSGGEEGARRGPSIMPGGSPAAWPHVKPIFQAIAAKVVDPKTGAEEPCCDWVGENGAGHYVKMTHNGIEYGDMQLICEAYNLMRHGLGMPVDAIQQVFAEWNRGKLQSYLIEITADILAEKDKRTGKPVVDVILDSAGSKGTGKWTSQSALDLGIAAPTIVEAVFARYISAIKDERVAASAQLPGPARKFEGDVEAMVEATQDALYASKIMSYAQGFALMREASKEFGWSLNFGEIARIWRGGCIIRAQFLDRITEAFTAEPDLPNLMLAPYFKEAVLAAQDNWRKVVSTSVAHGIPTPAFSSALAYFDSYRSAVLPANLIQAQRDYFGAHTYKRVDMPGTFHIDWPEEGRPELKVE